MKAQTAHPADVRSHVGDGWFDRHDASVGTADERNSYLFVRRVALQLRITPLVQTFCLHCRENVRATADGRRCERCGLQFSAPVDVVADVRCFTENDETGDAGCRTLSALAANALVGRTIAQAAAMADDDFVRGERIPWSTAGNGQPYLFADAVRAALHDWAAKATGRRERLPYPVETAERIDAALLTPFGRLLRRLGL